VSPSIDGQNISAIFRMGFNCIASLFRNRQLSAATLSLMVVSGTTVYQGLVGIERAIVEFFKRGCRLPRLTGTLKIEHEERNAS
jgi:hypothetical protein